MASINLKQNNLPKSTVIVSGSSSVCQNCGSGCIPGERIHFSRIGYVDPPDAVGCKIQWTHITTDHAGTNWEEMCKEIRPDLEFIRMYEAVIDE